MNDHVKNKNIVLFDGICNLCSAFFSFVYLYDHNRHFHFAWLQSPAACKILDMLGLPKDHFNTIIYLEQGIPYFKSDAFLKIVRHLRFPWSLLRISVILPRPIRDRIYDFVAQNRYKWFGKKDHCLVPTGELKQRFIRENQLDQR